MYDLIGAHVNDVQGGLPELVGGWEAAANVLLGPFPQMAGVHGRGATAVRAFPDDSHNPDFNDPRLDPLQAARVMVALAEGAVGAFRCSHVQITNEPAVSSPDAMARLADFDAECSRLMARHGRKVTLANLATGNPPRMDWWRRYLGAIQQGMADGAVLLLHAYTWPGQDDRWLLYRHRLLYDGCPEHGWEGLPPGLRPPLVLGELGFDYGVVEPGVYRGWRNLMDPHAYAWWLQRVNLELLRDPYVVGAAVFCCGNLDWKWTGYDVWPEPAAEVAALCTPVYRGTTPQPGVVNLAETLPRNPDKSYPRRRLDQIKRIIVHHTGPPGWLGIGGAEYAERIARYHVRRWGWAGIGYTYLVGEGGTIYKTAPHRAVTNHTAGYNTTGLGIAFVGDFREGKDARPNGAQLASGRRLVERLRGRLDVREVVGHKDKRRTACPGDTWDDWKHLL